MNLESNDHGRCDMSMGAVLRLIDANANRAREALRVLEDHARFVLDDADLCTNLKQLRHELMSALTPLLGEAILHRDTPGDVGTTVKTAAELHRQDLSHVVIAAGKRLGEALRSLEEFCKIVAPVGAVAIESLRYRFYNTEQKIALSLSPAGRFDTVRLYVLITQNACNRDWFDTARAAIDGGADALQLREKELESGEFLHRARRLVALCKTRRVICIINDRPDIAALSGADGVHLGQGDFSVADARRIVGTRAIIGVSTHETAQAKKAQTDGADYIGVGPVYRSSTKPRDWQEIPGLDYARQAVAAVALPVVAIAGITADNLDAVLATGVKAIAVTAAVTAAADPKLAAATLDRRLGPA